MCSCWQLENSLPLDVTVEQRIKFLDDRLFRGKSRRRCDIARPVRTKRTPAKEFESPTQKKNKKSHFFCKKCEFFFYPRKISFFEIFYPDLPDFVRTPKNPKNSGKWPDFDVLVTSKGKFRKLVTPKNHPKKNRKWTEKKVENGPKKVRKRFLAHFCPFLPIFGHFCPFLAIFGDFWPFLAPLATRPQKTRQNRVLGGTPLKADFEGVPKTPISRSNAQLLGPPKKPPKNRVFLGGSGGVPKMGQKGPKRVKKGPKKGVPVQTPNFPVHSPNSPVHRPNFPVHTPNYPVHSPNYRGPGAKNPAYIIYIGKTYFKIVQSLQSLNFFDPKKCPFSRSLAQLLDEKKGHFLCTFWSLFDDFLELFEKVSQKSRFFGQKSVKNRTLFYPLSSFLGVLMCREKNGHFLAFFGTFFPPDVTIFLFAHFLHFFPTASRDFSLPVIRKSLSSTRFLDFLQKINPHCKNSMSRADFFLAWTKN